MQSVPQESAPVIVNFGEGDRESLHQVGKVLATCLALRKHLNKVFLCDRKGERRYKKEMWNASIVHEVLEELVECCGPLLSHGKCQSYVVPQSTSQQTMIKKQGNYSKTTQNRRLHLSQPIDVEQTSMNDLKRALLYLLKKFSTVHSLHMHMDHRSCDVDKYKSSMESRKKPTKTLDL